MRILFTGCSTGFGATVREKLEQDGHEIVGVGPNGPHIVEDFTSVSPHSEKPFLFQLFGQGPYDAVINNAGITHIANFGEHSAVTDQDVLRVNLLVPLMIMREQIRRRPNCRIINTSSMSIYMGMRFSTSYVASKAAVEAASRCLAREFSKDGLIIAALAPGVIEDTVMSEQAFNQMRGDLKLSPEEVKAKVAEKNAIGRMCTHEELYRVIKFCLTDMPAYMSGTTIKIPGGMGC